MSRGRGVVAGEEDPEGGVCPPPHHAPHPAGIQTSQDARFYALSSRFEPFSNRDKTLVVQFTVKHEQNIDCGGGYVKLFPASLSQEDMHGDSEYNIMFGGCPLPSFPSPLRVVSTPSLTPLYRMCPPRPRHLRPRHQEGPRDL